LPPFDESVDLLHPEVGGRSVCNILASCTNSYLQNTEIMYWK